ncbi:MAG TPA: ADP-ribosylglycohydrolase family protein [Thermoanaerobaculaceae bacterium]|nr:ADP-ribosylglycohydrolase family protein [Thermoanaerobaculaceae bacterium]
MDANHRFRGSLLGLAVGDTVGTTVEFCPPGTFEPVTDMVGGGPFHLKPGQWTDDTSMALCLASSLVECGRFDAKDQAARYVRWWREGYLSSTGTCFDVGNATSEALRRFERTGEPFAGSTDRRSAGNGSLMRLAPAVLAFASDPAEAVARAADSSRVTHGAPQAVDACRYFAGLVVGALQGRTKEEILTPGFSPVPGLWARAPLDAPVADVASGSFLRKAPPEITGRGYVVATLEAALWAFASTSTFRDGCLAVVNLGDDADTTAAVYGQLAGAFYGDEGIPAPWLDRLSMRGKIETLADRLLELSHKLG